MTIISSSSTAQEKEPYIKFINWLPLHSYTRALARHEIDQAKTVEQVMEVAEKLLPQLVEAAHGQIHSDQTRPPLPKCFEKYEFKVEVFGRLDSLSDLDEADKLGLALILGEEGFADQGLDLLDRVKIKKKHWMLALLRITQWAKSEQILNIVYNHPSSLRAQGVVCIAQSVLIAFKANNLERMAEMGEALPVREFMDQGNQNVLLHIPPQSFLEEYVISLLDYTEDPRCQLVAQRINHELYEYLWSAT